MTEAPSTIQLHDTTPGVAGLSIALFVAACAYPPPRETDSAQRVWDAFVVLLEARGHSVSLSPHPMLRFRRRQWASMTQKSCRRIFDETAYRLLSRRLSAAALSVLLGFRPESKSTDDVLASHGNAIAAGRRVAGRFAPVLDDLEAEPANVRRLVWKQSRPVLHLACALKAELDREEMSAWDWPALALKEGQQERIRRMVAAAEGWRLALQRPALGARDAAGTVRDSEQLRVTL